MKGLYLRGAKNKGSMKFQIKYLFVPCFAELWSLQFYLRGVTDPFFFAPQSYGAMQPLTRKLTEAGFQGPK